MLLGTDKVSFFQYPKHTTFFPKYGQKSHSQSTMKIIVVWHPVPTLFSGHLNSVLTPVPARTSNHSVFRPISGTSTQFLRLYPPEHQTTQFSVPFRAPHFSSSTCTRQNIKKSNISQQAQTAAHHTFLINSFSRAYIKLIFRSPCTFSK